MDSILIVTISGPDRAGLVEQLARVVNHPGIVRDIFAVLARANVNVEELHTSTEAAPDSGGMLFRATARLAAPPELDQEALQAALSAIAMDLMVDLKMGA